MATANGGYSTGAANDEADLRQRNVSSYEKANGNTVYKLEAEDTKKLQKVVVSSMRISNLANGANSGRSSRESYNSWTSGSSSLLL